MTLPNKSHCERIYSRANKAHCSECIFRNPCIKGRFRKECPCKKCLLKSICETCCNEALIFYHSHYDQVISVFELEKIRGKLDENTM
jgi:hypothetical protein